MSENPQVSSENPDAEPAKGYRGALYYARYGVSILSLLVILIFDGGEFVKQFNMKTVANASMFSVPTEITTRFKMCNYKFLFFCELKPDVETCLNPKMTEDQRDLCIANVTSPPLGAPAEETPWWAQNSYLKVILYSAVMLPRLPSAINYMLEYRWGLGHMEFSMGVVFTLAYITLIVVALRNKSTVKFWYFVLAVVYGPYLILGIFWILQHALLDAAAAVGACAAAVVYILGVPGCLLICMRHETEALAKAVGVVAKGARV
jgi:hypothetical protein